jgi:hypothetical protein
MASLLKTVIDFFETDGWPYQLVDDQTLSTTFQGKHSRWTCYAAVREAQEQVAFFSVCPFDIPPQRFAAAAEFLHRANYGIYVGGFEMSYHTGRVHCKTGIDLTNTLLTVQMVKNLAYINVTLMDKYLPGLEAVALGEVSPDEAINRIEG